MNEKKFYYASSTNGMIYTFIVSIFTFGLTFSIYIGNGIASMLLLKEYAIYFMAIVLFIYTSCVFIFIHIEKKKKSSWKLTNEYIEYHNNPGPWVYTLAKPIQNAKIYFKDIESIEMHWHFMATFGAVTYITYTTFILKNGVSVIMYSLPEKNKIDYFNALKEICNDYHIDIFDPYELINAFSNHNLISHLDTIMMEKGLRKWVRP